MFDSDYQEKSSNLSLFENILASLKLGKFAFSLQYKIAGEIFTIQDLKHFVFKIKAPPKFFCINRV